MLQMGGDADLAQEALSAEDGAELRLEHFDRDEAIVLEVARAIHGGHPPTADFALDDVAALEAGVQLGNRACLHLESVSGQDERSGRQANMSAVADLRKTAGKRNGRVPVRVVAEVPYVRSRDDSSGSGVCTPV